MGSLSASGIPVVQKTSTTIRKFGVRIKETDSTDDTITTITDNRPDLGRPIGSGSIVRDDGSVEYTEEIVAGVTRMGRTCYERIASATGCARQAFVDLAGNQTTAVIESGLVQPTPQLWDHHTGERIVRKDSTDDSITDRVKSTGPFDKV